MRTRPGRVPVLLAALAPASLVLSHNLAYLVAYGAGFREALVATGHDGRWTWTFAVVLGLSALLVALAVARLVRLRSRARGLDSPATRSLRAGTSALLPAVLHFWPRLVLLTAILLVFQENLERLGQAGPLPGLTALLGTGPIQPFEIVALVSLLVAVVAALFSSTQEALVELIRAALVRRTRPRRPVRVPRPADTEPVVHSPISLHLGRRAPPQVLAS